MRNDFTNKAHASMLGSILRGTLGAVLISVLCILLFALCIKLFGLSDAMIPPVNQGIKIFSILAGVWIGVGRNGERGFLKGALIGFCYMALGIALFSFTQKRISAPTVIASDLLLGTLCGLISGILAANLRR